MLEWFEALIEEGEKGIDRLIDERTQESVQLDFKLKSDPSHGAFNDSDKKVLAKALSAFSNSAGGLLIWGINGSKGNDDIDCAQQPAKPVKNIEMFQSQASSLIGQLLQPKHEGIELAAIKSEKEPGSGYLLMRISRSERRPHRSEAKDQKYYYKRMGDSSIMMEHYDIEDAFKRIASPELSISWHADYISINGDDVIDFDIVVSLSNQSSITARFPYLNIKDLEGAQIRHDLLQQYSCSRQERWTCYYGGTDRVINPDTTSAVIRLDANLTKKAAIYRVRRDPLFEGQLLRLDYRFGCENARMKEGVLTVSMQDLNAQHQKARF